jgi:hypothetical protein
MFGRKLDTTVKQTMGGGKVSQPGDRKSWMPLEGRTLIPRESIVRSTPVGVIFGPRSASADPFDPVRSVHEAVATIERAAELLGKLERPDDAERMARAARALVVKED